MHQKPDPLHATLSYSAGSKRPIVCEFYCVKLNRFSFNGGLALAALELKEHASATMEGNVACFPLMVGMWEEY